MPESAALIPFDMSHDALVVVPTVADPQILVPCVRRLCEHADGRVRVVVVINSERPDAADESEMLCRAASGRLPEGSRLDIVRLPGPAGFARAVNEGLRYAAGAGGIPALTVVLNDDARVTAGWLRGLQAALDTETIRLSSEPPDEHGVRPDRDARLYGRIGLVGPVSNRVAGMQAVELPQGMNPDAFAAQHRLRHAGDVWGADFLSGFCVGIRYEALCDVVERGVETSFSKRSPPVAAPVIDGEELLMGEGWGLGREAGPGEPTVDLKIDERWSLFDERFGIGGYEDNDLCVRADLAGWRCVIAGDTFVHHLGHQTLDRLFPGQQRGLANRLVYLDKWAGHPAFAGRTCVALYRVKIETGMDLHYWRSSVARAAQLCDGIAVLLTGNPLNVVQSQDWKETAPTLQPVDAELLRACNGADAEGVCAAVTAWIRAVCAAVPNGRNPEITVDTWSADFDERAERNRTIEMGEAMGADWLLSIDHDESVEPRVDRALLERLLSHPDPMVRCWDFGWVNHWDSPRLVRQDPPWADGGGYRMGMRGFRLWRVSRAAPRRILAGTANGLHCGNCPDHDAVAKRVSGIRFRHYGYVRPIDRVRKHARYERLDPNPNRALTGGGYGHLVREEGMRISPFVAQDGIGLTMLVHAGESVEDVARHLDIYHGLVDQVALVWTDGMEPSPALLRVVDLFGATLLRHELGDDFAAARNAGLDHLRQWADPRGPTPPTLGWAWVVDPDEMLGDWFADCVALRRMAECSDTYGWLVRFANHRPAETGEPPTFSEAVRMTRLDPDGVMRYHGRVHEGFDAAMAELLARGKSPSMRQAPFTVHNPGLGKSDADLERKTRFYQRLLLADLRDDPDNMGAWTSLALQLNNDGHADKAVECLHRAILCSGGGFLPFRELGLHHLRQARVFLAEVERRVSPAHPYHQIAVEMLRFLRQYAPEQPLVGLARVGRAPQESDIELPPFEVTANSDRMAP